MQRSFLLVLVGGLLAGCATTFNAPTWESGSYSSPDDVRAYLDKHIATYSNLVREVDGGSHALAVPVILSAIGGTTAMALGAGTNVGIIAGSVGGAASAGTSYVQPRERLQLLTKAANATTCVRDEYSSQIFRARTLGLLRPTTVNSFRGGRALTLNLLAAGENFQLANPHLQQQSADAGQIAVDAARTIASNLQSKLADLGEDPDYAKIVDDIIAAQKKAEQNDDPPAGLRADEGTQQLVKELSEYEKRVLTCVAKLPA